jgi:hypothetical protein
MQIAGGLCRAVAAVVAVAAVAVAVVTVAVVVLLSGDERYSGVKHCC